MTLLEKWIQDQSIIKDWKRPLITIRGVAALTKTKSIYYISTNKLRVFIVGVVITLKVIHPHHLKEIQVKKNLNQVSASMQGESWILEIIIKKPPWTLVRVGNWILLLILSVVEATLLMEEIATQITLANIVQLDRKLAFKKKMVLKKSHLKKVVIWLY